MIYRDNKQGFTLTELVITTLVITILTTIAVPTIIKQRKKIESVQVNRQVRSLLVETRHLAFAQHKNIVICLLNANNQCKQHSTTAIISFNDINNNHQPDAGERLINRINLNLTYGEIILRNSNRSYIRYFGDDGTPRGHFGHIKYCPFDGDTQLMFQLSFNQQGLVRYKPYAEKPTGC